MVKSRFKKTLMITGASLLLTLGLISMVTPMPGGTLMIAISLTALIYLSDKVRLCLQWVRSRVETVNKVFYWIEKKVGTRFEVVGDTLKKTQPLEGTEAMQLSHGEYMAYHIQKEQEAKQQCTQAQQQDTAPKTASSQTP